MGLGYEAYESGEKTGMVFSWRHQQSERDGCGTRMRFRGFGRQPQCEEFSVIRKLASLAFVRRSKKLHAACAPEYGEAGTTEECGGFGICPVATRGYIWSSRLVGYFVQAAAK